MDVYEQLDQIPDNVIRYYLHFSVQVIQSPDSDVFKEGLRRSGNALVQQINDRQIEIDQRDFERYLLGKAISYLREFEKRGVKQKIQSDLEMLIVGVLKDEIKIEIPQCTPQLV
tara:strand:+ start:5738 stop:6079 length:342 start_codon:yes stop_codon:yes gene_type:complete